MVQIFAEMGIRSNPWFFIHVLILFFSFKTHFSIGADIISVGQSLSGNQTIFSKGSIFELGFFTPGNSSKKYYIGIWYKKISPQTIVWVANGDTPLPDSSSSELKFLEDGNLVLFNNKSKIPIWSTNLTLELVNPTIAVLLDSGNLVLKDGLNSSNIKWQSFDHQTNTFMPGSKIGLNKITNRTQGHTSWKSSEDPGSGIFSLEIDLSGSSQYFLEWKGSERYHSTGNWTGQRFSSIPEMSKAFMYNYNYVTNERESYFTMFLYNTSLLSRLVLDYSGQVKNFFWAEETREWLLIYTQPRQPCEVYGYCGSFSSCNQKALPYCSCLQGFEPRSSKDWNNLSVWWGGCVRKTPLRCSSGGKDTFFMMPNMKLLASTEPLKVGNMKECELACLRNCSCMAYSYENGCSVWHEDLLNLQELSIGDSNGAVLHIRIADSGSGGKSKRSTKWIVAGGIAGVVSFFAIVLALFWNYRRREFNGTLNTAEDALVTFTYKNLKSATRNFSEKLGKGGFGSVFRGKLSNSIDIAVKKLECLGKGEKQFRMEVSTLGIIQHANLVRLRGFCAERSERLLVYDYMPNGSLDSCLFGKNSIILDWKKRYQIALGTARGLAYLHEKCRDCIIHCDVKPENILLDAGFSSKVADFGLAKLFGRDFSRVLTTMRGTRGYLAPEWISGVPITPKADVYSFGMTLFEIISGRRNLGISGDDTVDYFPTLVVRKVHNGEEVLSLLDQRLVGNADIEELTRACRVACWCIQDDEKDRPTMGHVVQILEGVLEVDIPPIPEFFLPFVNKLVVNEVPEESSV